MGKDQGRTEFKRASNWRSDDLDAEKIQENVALCIREVLIHKKKYLLKPRKDFDIKSKLSMLVWQYILERKKEDVEREFKIPADLYEQHGRTVKEAVLKQLSTKRSTIVSNMKKAYCGKTDNETEEMQYSIKKYA